MGNELNVSKDTDVYLNESLVFTSTSSGVVVPVVVVPVVVVPVVVAPVVVVPVVVVPVVVVPVVVVPVVVVPVVVVPVVVVPVVVVPVVVAEPEAVHSTSNNIFEEIDSQTNIICVPDILRNKSCGSSSKSSLYKVIK